MKFKPTLNIGLILKDLQKEYEKLLSLQVFNEGDMNYTLLERQKPLLEQMAALSNSVVSVFDCFQQMHVFTSQNYFDFFGQSVEIDKNESRIHPEDILYVWKNAIGALNYALRHKETADYKLILEYRVRNATGKFVRVIEQQSILETDRAGNIWLALSVLDMSPDQSPLKAVKCSVFSKKDNNFLPLRVFSHTENAVLSLREIEILQMIKNGRLSKEISEQLYISVHTVNTHRQRILEKLDADNSMEAVKYASELGLLG